MTPSMFVLVGLMGLASAGIAALAVVLVYGAVWEIRQRLRPTEPPRALPPIDTRPLKRYVCASWRPGAYDAGLAAMVEAVRVDAGEDR